MNSSIGSIDQRIDPWSEEAELHSRQLGKNAIAIGIGLVVLGAGIELEVTHDFKLGSIAVIGAVALGAFNLRKGFRNFRSYINAQSMVIGRRAQRNTEYSEDNLSDQLVAVSSFELPDRQGYENN